MKLSIIDMIVALAFLLVGSIFVKPLLHVVFIVTAIVATLVALKGLQLFLSLIFKSKVTCDG